MTFRLAGDEAGFWAANAEADRRGFAEAAWKALKARGDTGLKGEIRSDIENSGIANARRVAKAVRGDMFPRSARAHASKPAYQVKVKGDYLAGILQTGGTVTARGKLLLVPLAAARKYMKPGVSHRTLKALIEARIGQKLIARPGREGRVLLGAVIGKGKRAAFVAFFVLKKSVTVPKKFDSDAVFKRFSRGMDGGLGEEIVALFLAERDKRVSK